MLYDGPGDLVKIFDGPNYGPLWFDRYPIAIVAHTTETKGLPDYGGGASAPQITIDPAERIVFQHQPLDHRGGALRGTRRVYADTGVYAVMNEKAVQVEIIGYSDKQTVVKYGDGRRWVGDFTAADYEFIAAVVHYLKGLFDIGDDIHARPSGRSWAAGISSPYRMGAEAWEQFGGFTAHGGIFGQTHFDTGVLDLHRIWRGDDLMTPEEKVALAKVAELMGQDQPQKALAEVWEKAKKDGLITDQSRPGAIVTDERFMAFLERWESRRMKKLVAAAIAGGAAGGATVGEVIAELIRRLNG
ncbi:MAG TPA: hypothetical protein VF377_10450 [Acidimicrobiia bacterium]